MLLMSIAVRRQDANALIRPAPTVAHSCQQLPTTHLVDDGVVHAGAVAHRAARLADGVNLVENDDMQVCAVLLTGSAALLLTWSKRESLLLGEEEPEVVVAKVVVAALPLALHCTPACNRPGILAHRCHSCHLNKRAKSKHLMLPPAWRSPPLPP